MKRSPFLILENPIDLNRRIIKSYLKAGDTVIDATCGNGNDALFCSEIITETGTLHCIDIQEIAISKTKNLLNNHAKSGSNVHYHNKSHSQLNSFIEGPIDLIVYNLGYLPGSDKSITTTPVSTIESLEASFQILKENGLISLMVYKGHDQEKELEEIQRYLNNLDPLKFAVSKTEFLIRNNIPILFLIEKNK